MNGKSRRYLRGLGHHLKAIVQMGQNGVTEGLLSALEAALIDHELVKVRIGDTSASREAIAERLVGGTGAELVQMLGKTLLLYRPHPETPTLKLPKEKKKKKAEEGQEG